MRKLYVLTLMFISSIGFSQNVVVNPTFADGLNNWSSTGTGYALPTLITNDGQDDNFSVQYVATATTGFDQTFNVVPGATVSVSFWYKAARTDGAATGNTARIWSTFRASTTVTTPINPPGTTGATNDPLRNNNLYLPQASTWTLVTINSEVPAGATVFQLQFRAYNGATVSFDNISFSSPGSSVLSTNSFETISGLKVYPNPVKNGQTLFITSDSSVEKNVAIYNVLGRKVLETTTQQNTINTNALTTGVYMVKITEEGKTSTRKLVIQ